ncbi:hypothetical protein [Salinibius halmophilus]|uniref:hypothetical protein n=1 Tax=Salinibius halmophilus TaxID=1853216 RepID=UPI001313F9AC|nr:hypothetical protein [Salinibius halmophilus]
MKNHTNMITQNKLAAASLLLMALSYMTLMVIYGAILVMPEGLSDVEKLAFSAEHAGLINFTYIAGYILFSVFLVLVNIATKSIMEVESELLAKATHAFGLIWAVLLVSAGLIAISSTNLIANNVLAIDTALAYYHTSNLLTEALGGGIEFIGGAWILLIGAFGFYTRAFGRLFSGFSFLKGAIGIATLFSTEMVLRVAFGLTGVIWFIWFAIALLQYNKQVKAV